MYPALQTRNLVKTYPLVQALSGCNLDVPAGCIVGLVGPNGAGKTTLLEIAVGLRRPTSGEVRVFGESPQENPAAVLPNIAFVPQEKPLYLGLSVGETLTMGAKLNPRWDANIAAQRIARLGIPLAQSVGSLSGGQRAQVALTLAIAKRAPLLLLDEPVANLDPLARREVLSSIVEAVTTHQITAIISSHIISELERVCNYVVILNRGQVQLTISANDLQSQYWVVSTSQDQYAAIAAAVDVLTWTTGLGSMLHLVVKLRGTPLPEGPWQTAPASLEDVCLAYLSQAPAAAQPPVYGYPPQPGWGTSS